MRFILDDEYIYLGENVNDTVRAFVDSLSNFERFKDASISTQGAPEGISPRALKTPGLKKKGGNEHMFRSYSTFNPQGRREISLHIKHNSGRLPMQMPKRRAASFGKEQLVELQEAASPYYPANG